MAIITAMALQSVAEMDNDVVMKVSINLGPRPNAMGITASIDSAMITQATIVTGNGRGMLLARRPNGEADGPRRSPTHWRRGRTIS